MSSDRVALVSDDQRLACSIQTHLKKAVGQEVFQCGFDSIRTHLSQQTDGLLLLATAHLGRVSQSASGHALGLRLLLHEGVDAERAGGDVRPVLHPSRQPAGARVWPGTWAKGKRAGRMMLADLRRAGIAYRDEQGR